MLVRRFLAFATDCPKRSTITKPGGCCFNPIIERNHETILSGRDEFSSARAIRAKHRQAGGHRFQQYHTEGVIAGGEDKSISRGVVTHGIRSRWNNMHVGAAPMILP